MGFILLSIFLVFLGWIVYENCYFRGEAFNEIRKRKEKYINDCNNLNRYIEELKDTKLGINQLDYGKSVYYDRSVYNYKRPELKKQKFAPNIYNCSRAVCDASRKQPFKYICKYFNITASEDTLTEFETVLNNFESVESGKILLKKEKEDILNSIESDIPTLISLFSKKRLEKELGFEEIDFSTTYFPRFIFKYISSGGNASTQNDIVLGIDNLNRFINYLSDIVKFKKSVAGQRALMTSALRTRILSRDRFTCQECGISRTQEPNILLEIDHIIPLSKGGITSEDNLQVLCWKCNRSKGNKIKDGTYIQKEKEEIREYSIDENSFFESMEVIDSVNKNNAESHNRENKESIIQNMTDTNIDNQNKINWIEQEKQEVNEKEDVYIEKRVNSMPKDYSAGVYVVGEDLPIGTYVLKPKTSGYLAIYKSYDAFLEQDSSINQKIIDDFRIPLKKEGMVIEVRDVIILCEDY